MKIQLFDFQKATVTQLRDKVVIARSHASSDNPQAIAFSAPTGSGKTIMMTALFEDILFGEAGIPAQPDAVLLWISDMPELNEQTRMKIQGKSDRIRVRQLVTVDSAFDAETLEGGQIYFINTQKLGTDKLLTKIGDNRKYPVWTTLSNTARAIPDRFYVVIDEAHRGMTGGKSARDAQTVMQRFVLGFPDVGLVKLPLVIGVSATPKRFMDLLEHAPHTVHKVAISADEVRLSGLLKDRILIHHPERSTTSEMSLLEEAARRWGSMTKGWGEYCEIEQEKRVWPILVVQIENGTDKLLTKTNLADAMNVIESAIGRRLNEGEIAHAMHDTGDLDIAGRLLRKVDASRIDENKDIGVVVFKTSLSTGWDCPRAEVMMSFRRAEDHTYIAQLLGRMVRTPLARRIERDAELNDVHLFLPHFDAKAVKSVIDDLQNVEEVPPSETGSSRELVVLSRREGAEEIFAALDDLVTYRVNAVRAQSHLRRFIGISRGLTIDEIEPAAWDRAKALIVTWMQDQLSALKASGAFADAEKAVTQIAMTTTTLEHGREIIATSAGYDVEVVDVDVDRLFEEAGRSLSNGVHMTYWQEHADRDAYDVKVEIIVLARSHAAMAAIESKAQVEFDRLYDTHKKATGQLREQRRAHYERLRLATALPTEVPWHLPQSIDFRRPPTAQLFDHHVFLEVDGSFRADLGTWEKEVLAEEFENPAVVGWLRNIDRKPWSLEIPYRTAGRIRPMFPDLLIIRRTGSTFAFDILEPHNPSLADNFEKAIGLAEFAERHGHLFDRIQLIRKKSFGSGGDHFVRLDINSQLIQKKLRLITNNPQLDSLFAEEAV